jgi:hypothetical protein
MTKVSSPPPVRRIGDRRFYVADVVEALCDHNRDGERVRDWLEGVVVQVDAKMVAVQFRQDVYLTDGWMVPDRVLWFQRTSENVRPVGKRSSSRSRGRRR